MNIGYHSTFMDRIIERADKRHERMEKMINKMLDKSEVILNAGKQTNEEWLRSCSAEELAAWIFQDRCTQSDCWYKQCGHTVKEIEEWLKEKHDDLS